MERAVEKRKVRLAAGQEIEGPRLVRLLERMVGLRQAPRHGRAQGHAAPPGGAAAARAGQGRGGLHGQGAPAWSCIRPLRECGRGRGPGEGRGARHLRDRAAAAASTATPARCGWATSSWARPEYKALYSAYEEFRELDAAALILVVDGGETPAGEPGGAASSTSWPRASAASPSSATRAWAR